MESQDNYALDYEFTFGERDKRYRLRWRHMKKVRNRRKFLRKESKGAGDE